MGGRRSRAQGSAWELGYQERRQQLQGAELAGGDFFNSQLRKTL